MTAFSVKDRKTDNFRKLIHYDVNVCSILGRADNNLITVWIQNFLKFGNLPKSCPIKKGNYSWYKLRPEKVSIPDVFPSAEYKMQIDTYFRKGKERQSVDNLTVVGILK
ncbi:uncharacterized protein LOC133330245 [Musca vetustissima]|uniref:uncharacterized protein LOC133330245 n=1 Tax=Musca vetustissima TaxID=27455 RepID=UPI002AB7E7E6|nr:uncharacterized protein LOC133330245 [Musca vetustissima]